MASVISIQSITTSVVEGGAVSVVLALQRGSQLDFAGVAFEVTPVQVSELTRQAFFDAGLSLTAEGTFVSDRIFFGFGTGDETLEITLPIPDDDVPEEDEIFSVRLVNPFDAVIGDGGPVTVTVTDNDTGSIFSIDDVTVSEADAAAIFFVTRSGDTSAPASVGFATADGSATAGADYVAQSGTLQFAAGVSARAISIPLVDDTTVENTETFTVNLSGAAGGSIGDGQGQATIVDDDVSGPPTLPAAWRSPATGQVDRDAILLDPGDVTRFIDAGAELAKTAVIDRLTGELQDVGEVLLGELGVATSFLESLRNSLDFQDFLEQLATNQARTVFDVIGESLPFLGSADLATGPLGELGRRLETQGGETFRSTLERLADELGLSTGADPGGVRAVQDFLGEHAVTARVTQTSPEQAEIAFGVLSSVPVLDGTDSTDLVHAGGLADVISGRGGADVAFSGAGADTVSGGGGVDLLFLGSGDDVGDGGPGSDYLSGGAGDDRLIPGGGADVIDGGLDSDTVDYSGSPAAVQVQLEGTTALTAATADGPRPLAGVGGDAEGDVLTDVENLTGSAFADVLTGDDRANRLSGGAGDDRLAGGAGADTLEGGAGTDRLEGGPGNDTYIVDDAADRIIELAGEGLDTVRTSVDLTLANRVENAVVTVATGLSVTGNGFPNEITGGAGPDTLRGGGNDDTLIGGGGNDVLFASVGDDLLQGGAGDDFLSGLFGADTLEGGPGDDSYRVQDPGVQVVEAAGEGRDDVRASGDFTLPANVENLRLIGTGAIDGTGNDLANTIIGNGAANVLSGGAGDDRINAGRGDDTLAGGPGSDRLAGNQGDDTYIVDDAGDVIVEQANQGIDTVRTSVNITLANRVENAVVTVDTGVSVTGNGFPNAITGGAGDDTLRGGGNDDTLIGGGGNDRLFASIGDDLVQGGPGDDFLSGIVGNDRLEGGPGNDSYRVDDPAVQVIEAAGEGRDDVRASGDFTLPANVENLRLIAVGDLAGTGNGLDNTIIGNGGANRLSGLAGADRLVGGPGDDRLIGGAGDDTLDGGPGNDIFEFGGAFGADRITGFTPGGTEDALDFSPLGITRADVSVSDFITVSGTDVLIRIVGTDDSVRLVDVTVAQLVEADDFIF